MKPTEIHFLFGFSRSGTSIVMSYLRGHEQIETGYEEPNHLWRLMGHMSWFSGYQDNIGIGKAKIQSITDRSIKGFVESFYGGICEETGKPKVVLKHPWLIPYVDGLIRIFPDSKFIILLRHPYDVIASVLDFTKNDDMANEMFYGGELLPIIELYKNHMQKLLEEKEKYTNKFLMIRFEDFVNKPGITLNKVFEFLGIPTTEKEMREILHGKRVVKTARVLEDLKIKKPKRKFLSLSLDKQKIIVKNLNKITRELGYGDMNEILKKEK